MTLVTVLLLLMPLAQAKRPGVDCDAALSNQATPRLTTYGRWVLQDGILAPTRKLEGHLADLMHMREPGAPDSVVDLIKSADHRLTLFDRTKQISFRLSDLGRGYQALQVRCARISNELRDNPALVADMVERGHAVVASLRLALAAYSGADVEWTLRNLNRTAAMIEDARANCLDKLPPAETGVLNTLGRYLFP